MSEEEIEAQSDGRLELPPSREYLKREVDNVLKAVHAWPVRPNRREDRTASAILRAVVVHLYVAWIHPFGDGNGRTARLAEFLILAGEGVPSPCAHLFSNHYNITRAEYHRQLDRSSRANSGRGDPLGFLLYSLQGFVDGLREQSRFIAGIQLKLDWEHFVYGEFQRTGVWVCMVDTSYLPALECANLTSGVKRYNGAVRVRSLPMGTSTMLELRDHLKHLTLGGAKDGRVEAVGCPLGGPCGRVDDVARQNRGAEPARGTRIHRCAEPDGSRL